jgi:hypothetical protein
MKRPATLAAAGLAGLAGLHVAWAAGSSWPLPDKAALSDAVIGRDTFPSAAACLIVAGALTAGSAFRRWLASIARAAAAHGRSRRGRCISCAGRAGAGRSNTSHLSHILVRAVPRIGPPRLRPSLPCARRASGASSTAASAAGLRPRRGLEGPFGTNYSQNLRRLHLRHWSLRAVMTGRTGSALRRPSLPIDAYGGSLLRRRTAAANGQSGSRVSWPATPMPATTTVATHLRL